MNWTFDYFWEVLKGFFIFALLRISKNPVINAPAKIYIFLIRGTPLLLQLLFIYFGLVHLVSLNRMTSAVIALGIHNGAYIAEIFRGAIQGVDRGQREAGKSCCLTNRRRPWIRSWWVRFFTS